MAVTVRRVLDEDSVSHALKSDERVSTSVQQETWLRSLSEGGRSSNIPIVLRFPAGLDRDHLASSLTRVATRHAALRMALSEEHPTHCRLTAAPAEHPWVDLSGRPDPVQAGLALVAQPFEPGAPLRWRAATAPAPDGSDVLVVSIDHLVADGASVEGLTGSLVAALTSADTATDPVPDLSYVAFARDQRGRLEGAAHDEFWIARRRRWGTVLPRILPRPEAGTGPVEASTEALDEGVVRARTTLSDAGRVALDELARRHTTTRFVVVAAMLLRATIVRLDVPACGLKTDFHGRPDLDVMETVGLFSHGIDIHLSAADAGTSDDAVAAVARDLDDVSRWALPRRAVDFRLGGQEALPEPPHLYLVTARRPFRVRAVNAHDHLPDLVDTRPFLEPVPSRLTITIVADRSGVHLDVLFQRRAFSEFPIDDVLGMVQRFLEPATS